MPIYAYRCDACGHAQDVLQKLSDPVLTVCPACGQSTFAKQLTAAGFQLKGSGWYVTDFRDGNKGGKKPEGDEGKADAAKPEAKPDTQGESTPASSEAKPASASTAPAATASPAAAPPPTAAG
ncbi:MAG: FmdB family zinc ribbon protein [Rubrivivax sp.]|jgi:putative FmdB family regulatory protein|nr:zinc ribbon domain-containing protein [Rubrivivax sp.]